MTRPVNVMEKQPTKSLVSLLRTVLLLTAVTVLLTTFSVARPVQAQADTDGIRSVIDLAVTPNPVVAGNNVVINWTGDVLDSGTVTFRVYIPADWYDQANWQAGTGVTASTLTGATYNVSACSPLTIGGIPTICAQYSSSSDLGDFIEAIDLSFVVTPGATAGSGRPVRVSNNGGSGGTPNISTVYVTVQSPPPTPTTRYVGNADCGGNTPCDTGIGALQTAVNALPASGGTIYVYGAHDSSGAAIGTKNITLRPVDSSASLNGACAGSLVELDDSGNLTVNGLAVIGEGDPGTSCFIGVEVTGTGNLTVQNGATFEGWYGDGFYAAYGVSISGGSGTHSISSATFADNATGLNVEAGTTTVSNSVFEANSDGGVMIDGGTLTIENSNLSNNLSYGLFQYAGTVTLRGNAFNGNSYYAFVNGGGTMTAFANNITGNNDGDYQAYIASTATVAKNWWGSFSDPNVGPSDGSSSYADGWDRRLGAPVDSWVAGTNSVVLGDARLSGSGDAVIISFGRGSSSAPFGNGIPPYVNRSCSDYYDFYALDNPTGWTVTLPVDTSTACITNVRNYEVAFTIDPANYDAACSTSNNPACWVRIPENKIVVSGNNLVITGQDLSYTHIVAGDEEGLDPTAVSLQSFGLDSRLLVWPLVMSLLALFGVTFVVVRRRQA